MKKFIGDKAFYKLVIAIAIPIVVQSGISNFVTLIDNIMVGQLGTIEMSAVAIVNQIIFVYNIMIIGSVAGPGIFGAQFFGNNDNEGVRHTFRFKIIAITLLTFLSMVLLICLKSEIISLYLNFNDNKADALKTLDFAINYFDIAVWGLPGFALAQAYASTLRETNQTVLPMVGGIIAVVVNTLLNYCLIFGNLGLPKLGIEGAAIATVIARYLEIGFIAIITHKNADTNVFICNAYKTLKVPKALAIKIISKATPLVLNELLWAVGVAFIVQCYSQKGLDAVAAVNINSTVTNLFSIIFFAIGNSLAIIVGQKLGSGDILGAKDYDTKLLALAVGVNGIITIIMLFTAPLIPNIYNTTDSVKQLATGLLTAMAFYIPVKAFAYCCYYTLRSGGKSLLTFIFDNGIMFCLAIPIAYVVTTYTNLSLVQCFVIIEGVELIKATVGLLFVKSGVWAKRLIATDS